MSSHLRARSSLTRNPVAASSNTNVRSLTASLVRSVLEFVQFENIGNLLSFRALPNEANRISVRPLVPHCVTEESAHNVPKSSLWFLWPARCYPAIPRRLQTSPAGAGDCPNEEQSRRLGNIRKRLVSSAPCVRVRPRSVPSTDNVRSVSAIVLGRLSARGVCWLASMRNACAALRADASEGRLTTVPMTTLR